ncbi:putative dehydrogenase tr07 [Arthroderma sp. PD_2]|nr:putative dehydrogenase tr07 [Arthroderma sp. PD_2]
MDTQASIKMNIAVFSAHEYDRVYFSRVQAVSSPIITLTYHTFALTAETASLTSGANAVCVFVNDTLDASVLETLKSIGVRAIFLRCAGYNNVDLEAAERLGLFVANVPSYSPESVAEFAVALLLTLNRKTHRAYNRVREGNFSLDGLVGFRLFGKTVGIVGTGKIGVCFARIMKGFGCRLIAYDPHHDEEFEELGKYVELDELLAGSDIVSLHCPLVKETRHIINADTVGKMKKGAMLLNTSRGGLLDADAVLAALKRGQLGGLALDVYEQEGALFYADHSADIIGDDTLMRLTTFPSVIISGHQAFFTEEALHEIALVTLDNAAAFAEGIPCKNRLVYGDKTRASTEKCSVRI